MIKKVIALIYAVICTYFVAVVFVSQLNIASITDMGFAISISQRFDAIGHDLLGMVSVYLPVILITLLIAFSFTSFAVLRLINMPKLLFPLAGFVGLIAVHLILKQVLEVAGIAPTRTLIGLLSQGCAGALGGYMFHHLANRNRDK